MLSLGATNAFAQIDKATIDSTSYLVGVNFGSFLKSYNFPAINYNEMVLGITDFLNATGKPTDETFTLQFKVDPNLMNDLFNRVLEATRQEELKAARDAEQAWLATNSKAKGVKTTESGLQYKIINKGNDNHPTEESYVQVTYVGRTTDGTLVDLTDSPVTFYLGQIIDGWTEGLQMIGEGGSIILYIPSALGYGEEGYDDIAPYTTLVFEIDLIAIVDAPVAEVGAEHLPEEPVITVHTAEEFLAAIGSNRIIEIDSPEPLILTDALDAWAEAGKIDEVSSYDGDFPQGISCYDNFDGRALLISGIANLTIRAKGEVASLYSRPRYADVLKFCYCYGITLQDIVLGHTDEGYCQDGVLGLFGVGSVMVKDCDLFGCGTEGVVMYGCSEVRFVGSAIHDCSYHIMHIYATDDVVFKDCDFYHNREYEQISVDEECEDITFDHCTIRDNQGLLFNVSAPIVMKDCTIRHSDEIGDTSYIKMQNTTIE